MQSPNIVRRSLAPTVRLRHRRYYERNVQYEKGNLVLIVSYQGESNAQLLRNFGLKVAVTSADQKYDLKLAPSLETKRRVGFNVGAFAEWFDVPLFSLLTQVEYAQRGMGQDFIVTGPSGPNPIGVKTLYSRLDYVSVPVLGKLRFPSGPVSPYIVAGPRADFFIGYKSDEGAFNSVYDKFKKTSFGGSAGIGIQIESMLQIAVLAEARYNFDFADSHETDLLKVRNSAFDFWLGIAF